MQNIIDPLDIGRPVKIHRGRTISAESIVGPPDLPPMLKHNLFALGTLKIIRKGESITEIIRHPNSIGLVICGALKTQICDADGNMVVLDFSLQGDLLGFENYSQSHLPFEIAALSTCQIFLLPMAKCRDISEQTDAMVKYYQEIVWQKLLDANRRAVLVGHCDADQKLAFFLLNMAARMHYQGYAQNYCKLPMSRIEISQYLFISPETVSRSLSRFQAYGYLTVNRNEVWIIDQPSLLNLIHNRSDQNPTSVLNINTHAKTVTS